MKQESNGLTAKIGAAVVGASAGIGKVSPTEPKTEWPLAAGWRRVERVFWAPVAAPERLAFNGTSALAVGAALEMAFGPFPIRLGRDQVPVLRGMVAVAAEGAKPYEMLLQALERYGALEVTCEP